MVRTVALSKDFAGFTAVDRVNLSVTAGHVHALVGPNGAGKTTLFNLLTGVHRPSRGRIEVAGRDVTGSTPERIAGLGVARSFQITKLFDTLTVAEHVELALAARTRIGYRFWASGRTFARFRDEAARLLESVGLVRRSADAAGSLPYGQRRALELACALALDPKVLLLDEPTAGMGVEDISRTVELIQQVRAGRTIVMVEHNMSVVADLADKVTVLQAGVILAEGPYQKIRQDPRVVTAYLGSAHA
ncbi:MAG: ABC transporter ATP-binding protein [Catenulispora sp.]|nr:ABC transporter ATP-binding protein [Catenulispora sp.]